MKFMIILNEIDFIFKLRIKKFVECKNLLKNQKKVKSL